MKRTYSKAEIAEDRCSWKFYKLIKEREREKKEDRGGGENEAHSNADGKKPMTS